MKDRVETDGESRSHITCEICQLRSPYSICGAKTRIAVIHEPSPCPSYVFLILQLDHEPVRVQRWDQRTLWSFRRALVIKDGLSLGQVPRREEKKSDEWAEGSRGARAWANVMSLQLQLRAPVLRSRCVRTGVTNFGL